MLRYNILMSYTPFWTNDPLILLDNRFLRQLWPNTSMSFEGKLNAITRLVILLTCLGFFVTRSINILIVGGVTILCIFLLYTMKKKQVSEAFSGNKASINNNNNETIINPATLESFLKSEFQPTEKKNPLGNVLLTEIQDTPLRKSAPPSFQTQVYEDINQATKKTIQRLNPDIKNTNKQLFGDLGEKFEFDQSMWNYYSTPNTKIPNDQGAFANWLYGDMPSARDGDAQALLQDNIRYNLY
jgi:Family of unknown function (DUF5762)